MKIVFIGSAADPETINGYNSVNKQPVNFVQQKWDYSFSEELFHQLGEDFIGFSYPSASAFLLRSTRLYEKKKKLEGANTTLVPCINLLYLKQFHYRRNLKRELKKVVNRFINDDIIFVTGAISYFSCSAVFSVAKKFNIKVISLVPDLPDFDVCSYTSLFGLKTYYQKLNMRFKYSFDGYVCFSKYQMEYLNKQKPYMIMEGFCKDNPYCSDEKLHSRGKFVVMYAGSLKTYYGIDKLVQGFINANIQNSELWIFGSGEYETELMKIRDERIKFKGVRDRDEILKHEVIANLLVNPRPTNEKFSYLSFPSKILEYMSSGTPVLTSHLGSIPSEYDKHLFYLNNVTDDSITDSIVALSNNHDLEEFGMKARDFVMREKNIHQQVKRVIDFVKQITY